MSTTDSMLARYQGELEEKSTLLESIVEEAERSGRDLNAQEMEMLGRTRDRINAINEQVDPLRQAAQIAAESRLRTEQIADQFRLARGGDTLRSVEYRSAGAYVMDRWRAGLGQEEAVQRIDLYHRAAAHQTTADNPGLLPAEILGPVINFVDSARPLVTAFGVRQLPNGSWSRPKVTQHTSVDVQAGEKTELVSQKMTITKVPVTAVTYGGYVNVSRQDIDWSQPGIMDIIIGDLASVYAQKTEDVFGDALVAGGTAATAATTLPTGVNTAQQVAGVVWSAAGSVYTATKGAGALVLAVSPDMLGLIGPIFAPVNPQNAQSAGFSANDFGQGIAGAISGITVVVSAQLSAGTMFLASTAAAEVYEDRIGSLQVVEPSVLGVQVAYAGYFAPLVIQATGIQKIVKTP